EDDQGGGGDVDGALHRIGMVRFAETTSTPAPMAFARTSMLPAVSRRVRITFSASPLLLVNTGPGMSKNSVPGLGLVAISKNTGTFAIPFPFSSITRAKTWVEFEVVMRGGSARSPTTCFTLTFPTVTLIVAEPFPPLPPPPPAGVVVGVVVEDGVVGRLVADPPERAWMCATPERLSDVKFTRAIPSRVLPCRSMLPMSVKNCTTVPSATGVPAGSMMIAVMTEIAP